MPPSKLERYLNILEVLVRRPRQIDYIAKKVNMELETLKRHLNFLVSNELIAVRRLSGKRVAYAINERGFSVFRTLRTLKYLEELKASLPIIEEAEEITSVLSKHSKNWKQE